MKTFVFLLVSSLGLLFSSCDVEPIADFDIDFATDYSWLHDNKDNIPRYPTYEGIRFVNKSSNGMQYAWDFGDGQTSTENEPVIHYEAGGEYTVTLTVQSETGNMSVLTKPIRIYERVIRKISLRLQAWDHNLTNLDDLGWAKDKVQDVVLEFGILSSTDFLYPSTIIYTSEPFKDMHPGSPVVSIFPKEKIQIDFNMLYVQEEPRPKYVVLLYAIENGERRVFYSSEYHPGMTVYLDYKTGLYKIESGSTIDIECVFE